MKNRVKFGAVRFWYIDTGMLVMAGWGPHTSSSDFFATISANDAFQFHALRINTKPRVVTQSYST
jgi:cyclophilin family peptidyl-prolyl cis-trans isomerase